jgi:septum site-determining protein MinC
MKQLAVIKSSQNGISVNLDPEASFEEILSELARKFDRSARFWGRAAMMLTICGRPMTPREEMEIVNVISEHSELEILGLIEADSESMKKTESAFRRKYMEINNLTGMFHYGSVKSGEIISVEPSIIVVGDVYEGALIESSGSIVVLGELAGTAKAGCCGNDDSVIVSFLLNTEDVSINGVTPKSAGFRMKKTHAPAAVTMENGTFSVKPVKKSFLDALSHKKCW